jgi:hypothetical protein
MRTSEGPSSTVAAGVLVGARDEQSCYEECEAEDVTWLSGPNNDARWGHMVSQHIGVSGGASLAALAGRRGGLGGMVVGHGQLTLQNDRASLAVSGELGVNVAGFVVGVDAQPWGGGRSAPNLTIYARRSLVLAESEAMDVSALALGASLDSTDASSWDAGVALRRGRLVIQYAWFRLDEGHLGFSAVEGSQEARSWHAVLLGWELGAEDAATVSH